MQLSDNPEPITTYFSLGFLLLCSACLDISVYYIYVHSKTQQDKRALQRGSLNHERRNTEKTLPELTTGRGS